MTGPLDIIRAIWSRDSPLSQRERAYLTALVLHSDNETGECFPSQELLAAETGSNERSARDVLRCLQERGLVSAPPPQRIAGRFPVTRYTILPSAILTVGNSCRRQDSAPPAADSSAHHRQNLPHNCSVLTTQSELPISAIAPPALADKGPAKTKSAKRSVASTSDHQRVKDCYLAEFRRARQVEHVPFGGREAKAINTLIEKTGGAEAACAAIRNAFADAFYRGKVSILTIANDPARFVGRPSPMAKTSAAIPRQRGSAWTAPEEITS